MKTSTGSGFAIAGFVLICSASAQAATLYTAPADRAYPTAQRLYCTILNTNAATATPKTVTIDILDYSGNIDATCGPLSVSSGAGASCTTFASNSAYCRFTVQGSKGKYRAMAIYDNGSTYTVAIPAQ